VPCRDEGQDLSLFAGGLRDALNSLPAEIPIEVLICVNGSGETFANDLASLVEVSGLSDFKVTVITSAEGKLEAMKTIARTRAFQGYLAFVDSDVVLAPNVLRRLWEVLETDSRCMISYGQPVPVFPRQPNLIHRLCRVHYALRDRAYHRPYFHGRAFMLRDWFFDDSRPATGINPALVKRLKLHRGPFVDDIAMSLMAVARWGTVAIREVREANVYFDPPDDLRGLYAGALRVALEIQRLDLLYPQHGPLQENVLTKSWRKHRLARFSWHLRAMHAAHRALDAAIKAAAQLHVCLVKHGLLKVDTLWIRVPGTKSFARHRLSWKSFKRLPSKSPRTP
jgi:hypothetical protein